MKRKVSFFLLFLLLTVLCVGCGDDFSGIQDLINRRVPWLGDVVQFKRVDGVDGNAFTLSTEDEKLIIEATDANAAAVGLNWYLKYYCHRNMSHLGDNLEAVKKLPVLNTPQTIRTDALYRYALNYCTYNYSMSFYTWEDWERELDWMALNGVNLMLVANGQEAVWQNTLSRLGYTEQEISDFITGPAFNAWWLMGNLEGWGGPMPQSQIDSRKEMVQQMLKRMKELGIEPLMPGFYGMVPHNFAEKTEAHVINQGNWCTFPRPAILDPTDPEFERIASIFYEETRRLYGEDIHFFSGDPFHEGGITEGVDLGEAGRAIQKCMQQYFPGSVWVLQGWQDNPKSALLEKLDKKSVLVQELFGENTNNWEKRGGYEGTPFIWATVTNFGERPGLNGKLQRFAEEIYRASQGEYASYMKGVGVLPEGIINNPVVYDLVLEAVWHQDKIEVSQWIDDYILARYGQANSEIKEAWQIFLKTIYSSDLGYQEGPAENVFCARPALEINSVSSWGQIAKRYDTQCYKEGVALFVKALPQMKESRTYCIDLVYFLRQVVANEGDELWGQLIAAYQAGEKGSFDELSDRWLKWIDIEDELLAQDSIFHLRTYQQQALDAGNTTVEKGNNLLNLMTLITYWGGNVPSEDYLHDYAYKEWAGLMSTYYKQRWEIYFDYLRKQMNGEQVALPDYFQWERDWVKANQKLITSEPKLTLEQVIGEIL